MLLESFEACRRLFSQLLLQSGERFGLASCFARRQSHGRSTFYDKLSEDNNDANRFLILATWQIVKQLLIVSKKLENVDDFEVLLLMVICTDEMLICQDNIVFVYQS